MRTGDRVRHFELLAPLGAGGMGQVWRARDTRLKREVALKLLPAELAADAAAMARLRREAELMAAVEHPNIAAIHSIEEEVTGSEAIQFLVLELVSGRNLAQRLTEGRLPPGEALEIGAQVACALQAAHERGVVHRDLKPANVMLGPRGRVKVLDFGIARTIQDRDGSTDRAEAPTSIDATATGTLVGTAPYMSPEQVRGRRVDARTDLWALGCLLYEMLSGERAFPGETPADVLAGVVSEEPRWERLPEGLPPAIVTMLRRCLRKDPEHRTWTAAEARRALETASGGVVAPDRSAAVGRRPRIAATALILVLVGALGLVLWDERVAGEGDPRSVEEIESLVALPPALEGEPEEVFRATHRALTNELADVVRVKVPPSEMEIDRFAGDDAALASTYRVDAFLLSRAVRAGAKVTLSVQLVDPFTRDLLWGRDYQGAAEGAELLIREAARGTRSALRPTAPPAVAARLSPNPQAQAQLELGRTYSQRYNFGAGEVDYERAHAALESALALDPGLAPAAAELSLLALYRWEKGRPESLADVGRWADLALRLDPETGIAWAARGLWAALDSHSASEFVRDSLRGAGLASDSAQAQFFLGGALSTVSPSLSVVALQRAAEMDPLHLYIRQNLGSELLKTGVLPVEDALMHLEHALHMRPDHPYFHLTMFQIRLQMADTEGVAASLRNLRDSAERIQTPLFEMAETIGALTRALRELDEDGVTARVAELHGQMGKLSFLQGPELSLAAITLLARAGRAAEAESLLQATADNPMLLQPWEIYTEHPDLVPLRDTSTLRALIERSREALAGSLAILEAARATGSMPAYLVQPYLELLERAGLSAGDGIPA